MKINPSIAGTMLPISKPKGDSGLAARSTFGEVFTQQVASAQARYDASSGGTTRSFSEMPIVAPTSTENIAVSQSSTSGSDTAAAGRPTSHQTTHGRDHVQLDLLTFEIIAQYPDATVTFSATEKFDAPVGVEMVDVASASVQAPRSATRSISANDEPGLAAIRPAPGRPANLQPVSVNLWRAQQGVKISVNAGSLSEDDHKELAARISEMAHDHGVKISELRISGLGRNVK